MDCLQDSSESDSEESDEEFYCPKCDQTFRQDYQFMQHYEDDHMWRKRKQAQGGKVTHVLHVLVLSIDLELINGQILFELSLDPIHDLIGVVYTLVRKMKHVCIFPKASKSDVPLIDHIFLWVAESNLTTIISIPNPESRQASIG